MGFQLPLPPDKKVAPTRIQILLSRVKRLLLSSSPSRKETFGMPKLAVLFALILFLIQVGLMMFGVQQNFSFGVVCWLAIIGLCIYIVWVWERTTGLTFLGKLLSSIAVTVLIVILIWSPAKTQYRREHSVLAPKSAIVVNSQGPSSQHPLPPSNASQHQPPSVTPQSSVSPSKNRVGRYPTAGITIAYPWISPVQRGDEAVQLRVVVLDYPDSLDERNNRLSVVSLFHLNMNVRVPLSISGQSMWGVTVKHLVAPEWNSTDGISELGPSVYLTKSVTVFQFRADARDSFWEGYLILRKNGTRFDQEQGIRGKVVVEGKEQHQMELTKWVTHVGSAIKGKTENRFTPLTNEELVRLGVPVKPNNDPPPTISYR